MKTSGDVLNYKKLSPAQRLAVIAGAGALVLGGCASTTQAESPGPQPTSISQEEPKQETAPAEESQEQPSESLMDFQPSPELVELTGIESTQQALGILKEHSDWMLAQGGPVATNNYDFWVKVADGDITPLNDAQVSSKDIDTLVKRWSQIASAKIDFLDKISPDELQTIFVNWDGFELAVNSHMATSYLMNALRDSELYSALPNEIDIECRVNHVYEIQNERPTPAETADGDNNLLWKWAGYQGSMASPVWQECYPLYKNTPEGAKTMIGNFVSTPQQLEEFNQASIDAQLYYDDYTKPFTNIVSQEAVNNLRKYIVAYW